MERRRSSGAISLACVRRGMYGYKKEGDFPERDAPPEIRILDITAGLVGLISKDESERKKMMECRGRVDPCCTARAGELLIALTGPPFKCAVAGEDDEGFLISENLAIATVDGLAPPEYVALYLNSPQGQRALALHATGSAGTMKITPKKLGRLEIPAPTFEEGTVYELARTYWQREKILAKEQEVRARAMRGVLQAVLGREQR
jgi:hypothetical protein